jgi:hypothetical protein
MIKKIELYRIILTAIFDVVLKTVFMDTLFIKKRSRRGLNMKRLIILLTVCIFAITFVRFSGNSNEHKGEVKTPSSSDQKCRDYQEVIDNFEEKGFININTQELDDLTTGWIIKDGEVESVSVDGNEDYSEGDWYLNDVEVIITYHTFKKKDIRKSECNTTDVITESDIENSSTEFSE